MPVYLIARRLHCGVSPARHPSPRVATSTAAILWCRGCNKEPSSPPVSDGQSICDAIYGRGGRWKPESTVPRDFS